MPGHLPSIEPQVLAQLRRLVRSMHAGNGRAVPIADLVNLARDVHLDGGLTIDFQASRELGQPMVILRIPSNGQPASSLSALSKREREVAALLADGLSNKQIAGRLFISLATVKDHVHRILDKSGLPNRAAVAAAYKGHTGGSEGRAG